MPTIAFVKKFRHEFEDHLNGKPCPHGRSPESQSLAPALVEVS
jgi:NADH-quinone oxidoreductase subunit F